MTARVRSPHALCGTRILIGFAITLLLAGGNCFILHAIDGEKGVPEAPPSTAAVAGTFYCGDGLGYNITLFLKTNGAYYAEWNGCLGNYGVAAGSWRLTDKRIALTPNQETDSMKGHLKTLDVLRFRGDWIFVRPESREFYDKNGVTRYSCFQKRKPVDQ